MFYLPSSLLAVGPCRVTKSGWLQRRGAAGTDCCLSPGASDATGNRSRATLSCKRTANAQASFKWACVCDACHYPGDASSPSGTFGSVLMFVSCCRATAAKRARTQLPAHARGIRSAANTGRCRLPSFLVSKRSAQSGSFIWLLCPTASKASLKRCSNVKKRLNNNSSFAVFSLLDHTGHTYVQWSGI